LRNAVKAFREIGRNAVKAFREIRAVSETS